MTLALALGHMSFAAWATTPRVVFTWHRRWAGFEAPNWSSSNMRVCFDVNVANGEAAVTPSRSDSELQN